MSILNLSKELLQKEYVDNNKTISQIAKENNCSHANISKKLDKYGIKKRDHAADLSNKTFGNLTAIKEVSRGGKNRYVKWLCICKCGKENIVQSGDLQSGATQSCGRCDFVGDLSGTVWNKIHYGAKIRGLTFDISQEYAWKLYQDQKGKCALSGLPITFASKIGKGHEKLKTASLDRINSDFGYTENNIQWVHKDINRMKGIIDNCKFKNLCYHVSHSLKQIEKVIIFGGMGYLGCQISRLFANFGYEVTIVDNFLHKQQAHISGLLSHKNINFLCHDILDFNWSCDLANEHDIVIPLAAIVGAPLCDALPDLAVATNLTFIDKLTKSLSTQLVIFPNSNSGYGQSKEICTEESVFNPLSLYGRTKCEAEKIAMQNHENTIALRLATVFGLSDRTRLDLLVNNWALEAFLNRKLEIFQPHFRRNFIHVIDIARCFLHCVNNRNDMIGECYNVGLDEANMTKLELAKTIAKHIDCEIITHNEKQDPDNRDYVVSSKKLYTTGFQPNYSLDDGIRELIKFYSTLDKTNIKSYTTMYNHLVNN